MQYHPGWKERQPIKWEERRIKLEDDIDDMFFAIDGEGGDKVLSREELKEKLRADDQLEHYLNLVGREASGIFEQIDANSDGVITQEEFQAILNTRGHSFAVAWLEEQIVWHERRNRKAGRNDDVARHPRTNELVSSRDLGQPLPALALLFGMQEDVCTQAILTTTTRFPGDLPERLFVRTGGWKLHLIHHERVCRALPAPLEGRSVRGYANIDRQVRDLDPRRDSEQDHA